MLQKILVSFWKLMVGIIESIEEINKLSLLRLKSLYVLEARYKVQEQWYTVIRRWYFWS